MQTVFSAIQSSNEWYKDFYDITGNACLDHAEVIFIADYFDGNIRQSNVDLINEIWSNHLVLVEFIPCGETVKDHFQIQNIRDDILIKGWDHPDIQAKAEKLRERGEIIQNLGLCVLDDLWNANIPLGYFLRGNSNFQYLMNYGSKKLQQERAKITETLNRGFYEDFYYQVKGVIRNIRIEHNERISKLYANAWDERLTSLIKAIHSGISSNGKVIVILSGSFIIRNRRLEEIARSENLKPFSLRLIRNYLLNRSYTIINAKQAFLSIHNQPKLWPQKSQPHFEKESTFIENVIDNSEKTRMQRELQAMMDELSLYIGKQSHFSCKNKEDEKN